MKSKIIVSMLLVVMMLSSMTGQIEDNVMTTKDSVYTDYPILEFKDKSDNKLADVEILKNTDQCLIDCETLGTITLYKDDKIFNEFEFMKKDGTKRQLSYKFYIELDQYYTEEQAVLDDVCAIDENLTTSCHYVQVDTITVQKTRKVWQQYDGKKLSAGTYRWKILATKDKMDSIDWSFTYQGIGFDEVRKHYVWWDGSWYMKKEIKIDEIAGSTIANYTADLTIPITTGMRPSEVRFVNSSQTGELGYWIYYSNTSEFRVRVLIPTNLVAKQNNSIWLYYNNPSAASTSDIADAHIVGVDGTDFTGWTDYETVGNMLRPNTTTRRLDVVAMPRLNIHTFYRPIPSFQNYSFSFVSSYTAQVDTAYAITGLSNSTVAPFDSITGTAYTVFWRTLHVNFYGVSGSTLLFNNYLENSVAQSGVYHTKVNRYGESFNLTVYKDAYVTKNFSSSTNTTGMSNNINVSIMVMNYDSGSGASNTGWITNYSVYKYIYPEPIITFGNMMIVNSTLDESSITYNLTTYETSSEQFIAKVVYNSSIYSSITGTLIYNGTSYLGTKSGSGNSATFTRFVDIPVIEGDQQNKSFFWMFTMTNTTGIYYYNTSVYNQTVNKLVFTICNATYPTPKVVNYTTYNEESLEKVNVTWQSTFFFGMDGSSVSKNYTYNSPNINDTFTFCSNTTSKLNVDAVIKLTATGYNDKTIYLNDEKYNGTITHKFFYLLPNNNGTDIIIDLKDQGLNSLEGYYIKFDRYYPSTNSYLTVIEDKTDALGQIVAKLIENVVRYRVRIYDPDNVLVKTITNPDLIIACKTTICVQQIVVEDTTDDFDRFNNITDLTRSLTFNKATNTFTASWTDLTGQSATYRLQVYKISFNGSTLVTGCNESRTLATGSLTCTVPSSGSYHAQFFRKVDGDEIRIDILNVKVGEVFKNYSKEGLLWVLLILLTLVGVGSFDPNVGVGLYMVGFILLGLTGLISLSWMVFIANTLLCCVFFWAFNR